jgi:flagellar capping protein FliD
MPVTDMVNQIMRGHSVRLERMRQQREVLVWQRDLLRNTASDMRAFRDQFLSFTTNQSNNIRSEANFSGRTTKITNAAGDDVRGITVGGTATGTQRIKVEEDLGRRQCQPAH